MDTKKIDKQTGSAEAENRETMDLLTGMLDAATHCGRENPGDSADTAGAAGAASAKTASHRDGDTHK